MNKQKSLDLKERLKKHNLSEHAFEWLLSETDIIEAIIERYIASPEAISIDEAAPAEVIELRRGLQADPNILLDCLAASSNLLVSYQKQYDRALTSIAKGVGLDITNISPQDLARALELRTVTVESTHIQKSYQKGGKLAVCMLGMGGTGKGTLIAKSKYPRIVNHTSRDRRPGEVEGRDYYYLTNVDENTDIESIIGPVLADLIRPGRGRYMTSLSAVKDVLENSDVAFIEQSPGQVAEIIKSSKNLFPELRVQPVCILPPGRGIVEIATRVIVRTYGDPNHQDSDFEGYKIKDSYLESTMGMAQIEEVSDTIRFIDESSHSGIAYIVNDNLTRAIDVLDELISPSR